jgi:hypothetical protein
MLGIARVSGQGLTWIQWLYFRKVRSRYACVVPFGSGLHFHLLSTSSSHSLFRHTWERRYMLPRCPFTQSRNFILSDSRRHQTRRHTTPQPIRRPKHPLPLKSQAWMLYHLSSKEPSFLVPYPFRRDKAPMMQGRELWEIARYQRAQVGK